MRSLSRIGPATAATIVALLFGAACGSRSELTSAIDGIASSGNDGGSSFDGGTIRGRDAGASDAGSTCAVCAGGQTRCANAELETCVPYATGCGQWDDGTPCPSGDVCAGSIGSASCRVVDVRTPRLLAPLSTATATSHRPRLSWILAGQDDGAEVDICTDRACSKMLTTFSAVGTSGTPSVSLAPGVYFWRARGSEGGIVGADTSAVWQLIVPARDTPTNTAWGSTFDGNGDGFADVVVGVQDTDQLEIGSSGAAYFFAGGPSGVSATPTSTLLNPPYALGTYVASAGDVNGDGFADLAVGCGDANGSAGLLSIYLGSSAGPIVPGAVFLAAPHEFEYGAWVSNAGDVNGDGYGDLLVSKIVGASRVVQVFLGGPAGLAPSSTLLPSGAIVALTAASDVNADGFTDVLVAKWGEENSNAGALDEYLGGPSGLPSSPSATFPFTGKVENFFVVNFAEVGDVNGDGYGDVIAGNDNIGTLTILLGSPSGLVASTTLHNPNPSSHPDFGSRLTGGHDIDHDGFDDVVVGAPGFPIPAVYIYFGASSGLATTPLILSPPSDGALGSFGDPVGGAGDVDGDGFDDLMIGGLGSPGAAWFYRGAKNRSPAPSVTFTGPAGDYSFSDSLL